MARHSMCRNCLHALRLELRCARRAQVIRPLLRPTPLTVAQTSTGVFGSCTFASTTAALQEQHTTASSSDRSSKRLEEDAPAFIESDIALKVTETLFKECARQADYIIPQAFEREGEVPKNEAGEDVGEGTGWWYENLGLTPTFNTWAQVTFLHMYLLTARLRYLPDKYAPIWLQHFHDHFFYEAEHRMTIFHGLTSRMIRNRYLKELYNQWLGLQGAYDEGLIKGDAVLGGAVWRNIFKADDNVDWRHVALVVAFMRRGLKALDGAHDKTIVGGLVKFGNPMTESPLVEQQSEELSKAFTKEEEDEAMSIMEKTNAKST